MWLFSIVVIALFFGLLGREKGGGGERRDRRIGFLPAVYSRSMKFVFLRSPQKSGKTGVYIRARYHECVHPANTGEKFIFGVC